MDAILLIILVVIILFGLSFSLFSGHAISSGEIPRDNGQTILDPKGVDDGLALVVFQPSKNGTIDEYARLIAETLFQSGYKVIIDTPSLDLSVRVTEYDLIILGSAVSVGQFATPLLDYIYSLPSLKNKTIGLFSNGRAESTSEFDEVEAIIKGKPRLVTAKFTKNSVATPLERAQDFVYDLLTVKPNHKN